MGKVLVGIFFLSIFFYISLKPDEKKIAEIEECTKRGISYFAQIGSYPKLKGKVDKGRYAKDVAKERCERTITAF